MHNNKITRSAHELAPLPRNKRRVGVARTALSRAGASLDDTCNGLWLLLAVSYEYIRHNDTTLRICAYRPCTMVNKDGDRAASLGDATACCYNGSNWRLDQAIALCYHRVIVSVWCGKAMVSTWFWCGLTWFWLWLCGRDVVFGGPNVVVWRAAWF